MSRKTKRAASPSASPPEVSSGDVQSTPDTIATLPPPCQAVPASPFVQRIPVTDVHWSLPQNVYLGDDGSITYTDEAGFHRPCPISRSSSGKAFVKFDNPPCEPFTLWLARAFYTGFVGHIPAEHEAFPIDGNHANLKPANLALRRKIAVKQPARIYRPQGGCGP
jgi:hypothetical protein